MRLFGIGMCMAASLLGGAAFGQSTPRTHTASGVVVPEVPYLGVGGQDVSTDRAHALRLKEERGVEVTNVEPDSGAARAGMKEGDVVLEFNGQKVEGWEHLKRLVHETPIHREIKIIVWRNGATQTFMATVGAHKEFQVELSDGSIVIPQMRIPPIPPIPPMPQLDLPQVRTFTGTSVLGIMGEPLGQESQLADFFGVKEGVLVRSVTRNSAAEKAGIKAGDVIIKIDDAAVSSSQQISSALRAARARGTVNVTVVRNKKETPISVTLDSTNLYRGQLRERDGTGANGWVVDWLSAQHPTRILWQ